MHFYLWNVIALSYHQELPPLSIRSFLAFSLKNSGSFYDAVLCNGAVQLLSYIWLFVISCTVAHQAHLSNTVSQSLLKLMSIVSVELLKLSNHLFLCHPLLHLPSASPRIFGNESTLCTRWPMYWSFIITPSNEYLVLISLQLTGLSPGSWRDSQESSPAPQGESINSFVLSLLYGPISISIHDYGKNCSFDYMYLCWQSVVCAF